MSKKLLSALLAALLLCSLLPTVSANFNDSEMNWDDHTQHVYDDCYDAGCNVCGETRTVIGHVYTADCDATCDACDFVREAAAHVSDSPACQDGICTYCGVSMPSTTVCVTNAQYACQDGRCVTCDKVMYATADHTVDNGGDTVCNVCGGEVIPCDHAYDNDCDATCNKGCGYVRPVNPHEYTILNQKDENGHWHECACGAKTTVEPHTYIIRLKDEKQHWRVCDACSHEEAGSRADHSYQALFNDVNHWQECSCGDTIGDEPHAFDIPKEDENGHHYECACGKWGDAADHVWVNGSCSVCAAASPTKVTITTQPKTTYGKEGATVKLTVKAEGEGLKYTWYIKNNGKTSYSKSSVTSATYSVKISTSSHNRRVYCVVTDKYGNKVQANTVLIRRQATITKEPATVAYAKNGAKASVKITALGDGLKYTWYVKNDGATKYSKSSVTSATYSATMSDKVKGRRVYVIVTDKYGKKVQSKTFLLRMAATITTQPKTVTVKKNTTAKVTVKAKGDGLKYTWYVKNAGSSKYSKSSITKSTYSVKMTSKVNGRYIYCVVTDKYGKTVKSSTVRVKMK